MKHNTIILLVVLLVVAGFFTFADGRYGTHHYFGSSWGPGHMWQSGMYGPGHMWDDHDGWPDDRWGDGYGPGHMWEEYGEHYGETFKERAEAKVIAEQGQPIEGIVPFMLLQAYPGLTERDFDGVDAAIGHYEYVNGELIHDLEDEQPIHSAAEMVTDEGYETLLENVAARLGVMMHNDIDDVLELLAAGEAPDDEPVDSEPMPPRSDSGASDEAVVCTDEMKQAEFCTMEYAPVCGLVEVQCITEPCDPVPETFSNGCVACSQGNVISYTPDECSAE